MIKYARGPVAGTAMPGFAERLNFSLSAAVFDSGVFKVRHEVISHGQPGTIVHNSVGNYEQSLSLGFCCLDQFRQAF